MALRTVKEVGVGKARLRLLRNGIEYEGVVILDGKILATEKGADGDRVWTALHDALARSNPSFFGWDGARERFLKYFPAGFDDPDYAPHERDDKDAAKRFIDENLPIGRIPAEPSPGPVALKAFQATNLLSPFEKVRLKDALNGPRALQFLESAEAFALGDVADGLRGMAAALKPHDGAKWTVVTYLPYFWRPETHMFLKPEATIEYAARVGHRFAHVYKSDLDPSVYECLLDLTEETKRRIADLSPRDNIDVQSFLWTTIRY